MRIPDCEMTTREVVSFKPVRIQMHFCKGFCRPELGRPYGAHGDNSPAFGMCYTQSRDPKTVIDIWVRACVVCGRVSPLTGREVDVYGQYSADTIIPVWL